MAPTRPRHQAQKHFRFLDLPLELQDLVLEEVFADPGWSLIFGYTSSEYRSKSGFQRPYTLHPSRLSTTQRSILVTSKHVAERARRCYYTPLTYSGVLRVWGVSPSWLGKHGLIVLNKKLVRRWSGRASGYIEHICQRTLAIEANASTWMQQGERFERSIFPRLQTTIIKVWVDYSTARGLDKIREEVSELFTHVLKHPHARENLRHLCDSRIQMIMRAWPVQKRSEGQVTMVSQPSRSQCFQSIVSQKRQVQGSCTYFLPQVLDMEMRKTLNLNFASIVAGDDHTFAPGRFAFTSQCIQDGSLGHPAYEDHSSSTPCKKCKRMAAQWCHPPKQVHPLQVFLYSISGACPSMQGADSRWLPSPHSASQAAALVNSFINRDGRLESVQVPSPAVSGEGRKAGQRKSKRHKQKKNNRKAR